jgi:hypothetical protein
LGSSCARLRHDGACARSRASAARRCRLVWDLAGFRADGSNLRRCRATWLSSPRCRPRAGIRPLPTWPPRNLAGPVPGHCGIQWRLRLQGADLRGPHRQRGRIAMLAAMGRITAARVHSRRPRKVLHAGRELPRVPHGQAQRQVGREFMRRLPGWQTLSLSRHVRRARVHGLRPRQVLHAGRMLQRVLHGQVSGRLGAISCDHCPADICSVSQAPSQSSDARPAPQAVRLLCDARADKGKALTSGTMALMLASRP